MEIIPIATETVRKATKTALGTTGTAAPGIASPAEGTAT
jgi:hypothetical protein